MTRISKTQAQRIHMKRRAQERFGLTLNRDQYHEIVRRIQQSSEAGGNGPDCKFLSRESLRLTHWEIQWGGRTMHAVYDKKRKNVVTVWEPRETGVGDV